MPSACRSAESTIHIYSPSTAYRFLPPRGRLPSSHHPITAHRGGRAPIQCDLNPYHFSFLRLSLILLLQVTFSSPPADSLSRFTARLLLCILLQFQFQANQATVYDDDEVSAIVLDLGSHTYKASYAGEDAPKAVFPSEHQILKD